jgi:L-serine dehydratase
MANSVFEIFKIGIGPSSSHTMGPMLAGALFARLLEQQQVMNDVRRASCELFGSLAMTGKGHGTDRAVLLGLMGHQPDAIDPATIDALIAAARRTKSIDLLGTHRIAFDESTDLLFRRGETLPGASCGLRMKAFADDGKVLVEQVYFSIGGGFVVTREELHAKMLASQKAPARFDFVSAAQLLESARDAKLSIAEIQMANELCWRGEADIRAGLRLILKVMDEAIAAGVRHDGVLPGGLNLPRRAPAMQRLLAARSEQAPRDPLASLDWISLYAIAVGEENAAGGRCVTAPTLGSAGVIPSVLRCYRTLGPHAAEQGEFDFLLTAAAIGALFKRNATIAGAEGGCQAEIGTASAMAAGGYVAALGGSPEQVAMAAEIAMEHMLGLTCDPIEGLVQVPCIERTAMGAVHAITAARLALDSEAPHLVSLDQVIDAMRRTGVDMSTKYKETSLGGLALEFHLPKC